MHDLSVPQRWTWSRAKRSARRLCAAATGLVLVAGLTWAPPAQAEPPPAPAPRVDPVTPGRNVTPSVPPMKDGTRGREYRPKPPVWPVPGASTVDIPAGDLLRGGPGDRARAAGWARWGPVLVAAASGAAGTAVTRARIQVLDPTTVGMSRATRPALLRVGRADDPGAAASMTIGVQYAGFAQAYGADWSTRLRMATLPECALTTPSAPGCQPTRVASHNDTVSKTVTGPVTVSGAGGTLVVLLADSAGGAGDYAATSLKPSATWSAGGSSGDFSWSYPMRVPPPASGPLPSLALAYSSQSVDGRHAATNNQPSWIGEGFEFAPGGFIERKYVPCSKDMTGAGHNNTVATGDLCWKRDNATLSMSGHAGELIFNATEGRWHLRGDDGSKVERLTGAANGDNNGEHWRLTTLDGTQYFFGKQRLNGWTTGKAQTDSVLTVPVFGNNPNEPCHQAAFAASSCSQAWRWNLDYIVDPHGNTMSLWYLRETNRYGRNNTPSDAVQYHRGGWVDHIDYGTNNRGGTDTEYVTGGVIQGRVLFTVADRCLSSCTNNANWPDTPMDQECAAAPCGVHTPTFWTKKRLTGVRTRVWNAAASPAAFKDVELWTLTQSFPDPMDSTRAGLWLQRISHTGLVGGTASVPDVTFGGTNINNRVNPGLYGPGMAWWRVDTIRMETGGEITIDYSGADCTPSSLPVADTNKRRCYPSVWTPPGFGQVTDWFHRYVAIQITETDLTGGAPSHYPSPTVLYRYDYPEPDDPDANFRQGAAWHYTDDDGLVDDDTKTWSVWRGYDRVRVITGQAPDRQTFTETRYFRGMHGDKLSSGTRTVNVGNTQDATTVPDEDWWAGQVREQIVIDGPGGTEVSGVVNVPWASGATATRTVAGVAVHARFTAIQTATRRTALASGGFLKSSSTTTFDTYGQVVQVEDNGDDAVTGDERCVKTAYAYQATAWLLSYPKQLRSFALSCAAASDPLPAGVGVDDVLFETRMSYDGQPWGTPPTKGDVTQTQRAKAWSAGAPTAFTTSTAAYDPQGRNTDKWNELGRHAKTDYTPTAGGPLTRSVATSPDPDGTAGSLTTHAVTTEFEPAFAVPVRLTDPNGRVTDTRYDPLGRLTEVYRPGRVKGTHDPNTRYTYSLSATAPSYVKTESLRPNADGYTTAYAIYDGLLRPRQQQTPQPTTGRIVTETFYDSAGRSFKTYGPLLDNTAPSGSLYEAVGGDSVVQGQINITQFDGVSRPTAKITKAGASTELWRTTYAYGGDRTHITPPVGATATTTITDVRGNPVALRLYKDRGTVGSTNPADYDETTSTFNRKGQQTRVTDAAGNHWDFAYDLLGRATGATDPDKGAATSVFDDLGQLLSTTDARGITLSLAYDNLGRKTSLWQGTVGTGTKRAEWTYDTVTNGKGQLATSIRYDAGLAYTYAIGGYSNFYQPTSATITIPPGEAGLDGSYQYLFGYTPTGAPLNMRYPAIGTGTGALGLETVTYTYRPDQLGGLPNELRTNWPSLLNYITSTTYTSFGEVANTTYDTATVSSVVLANSYEQYTRRVSQTEVSRLAPGGTVAARFRYDYDQAGNVTKLDEVIADDTQCFTYDYARRLTEAWTPGSGDCGTAPSAGALGGPAPYWTTWTINTIGNRTQQVQHAATGDTTTTYSYPVAGAARPHGVTNRAIGSSNTTYGYDNAGNTLSRPTASAGQQTLTWDAEGHLATTTDSSGSTSYLYDPDGGRLIRRDAGGKTLYLPGQEVRSTAAGRTATRYYTHGGTVRAMRTPDGFTWVLGDRQGSINLTIDPASQNATQRRQDPYGNPRGTTSGSWLAALDKGFVGGTQDPTGLTHLGAREYDPLLGSFISVDPVMDLADPQQWNPYAYGNNNPVTFSDPSGLVRMDAGKEAGNPDVADAATVKSGQGTPPGAKETFHEANGTVVVVYPDGSFTVDGYRVYDYPGQIDPRRMAAAVDEIKKNYSPAQQANTPLMIYEACWMNDIGCSYDYTTYLAGEIQEKCKCPASPIIDVLLAEMEAAGMAIVAGREGGGGGRNGRGGGTRGGSSGPPGLAQRPGQQQPRCSGALSFDADTEVVLADGTTRPISELEPGDQVLATDPETGQTAAQVVTHVWVHQDTVVELALGDGGSVTTTEDHPFWNATDRQWQDAQDLDPGDRLLTSDGRTVTVAGLEWSTARTDTAYNLTVLETHTYYVVAGTAPVLVHNCPDGTPAEGSSTPRATNPARPGESPIWQEFSSYRGNIRSNGLAGKDRQYYQWDYTHNDIEVYNSRGTHLGSMDPTTGRMYKPPVAGRTLNLQ